MDPLEIEEEKLLSDCLDYIKRKNIPLDRVLSVALSILVASLRSCEDRAEAVNLVIQFLEELVLEV
jgi:hypothetical protein